MNVSDRIELSCKKAGISQTSLAKMLDITKGSIFHLKTGRIKFAPYAERISTILGVPQEWLEHGTGPAPAWLTQPDSVLPPSDTQTKILNVLEKILEQLKENDQDHLEIRRALTRLEAGQTPARLSDQSPETPIKTRTA